MRDLACTRGGRRVFSGLSFELASGGVLQVRGANGSGKSSLLRLLCGLLQPTQGEVQWRQRPISAGDAGFAHDVAYLGHASGLDGDLTVLENLQFSLRLAGSGCTEPACSEVLHRWCLAGRESERVRHLSQGLQRRLALARVRLSRRALWLLDEPCAGLDADGEACLEAYLADHAESGGLAVVTTHRDLGGAGRCVQSLDMDALSDAGRFRSDHRS